MSKATSGETRHEFMKRAAAEHLGRVRFWHTGRWERAEWKGSGGQGKRMSVASVTNKIGEDGNGVQGKRRDSEDIAGRHNSTGWL